MPNPKVSMQYGSGNYSANNRGGSGSMTLLWTNPNPTSNFSAQTITVDLSSYSHIMVDYKTQKDADRLLTAFHCVGFGCMVIGTWSYKITQRQCTVNTSSIDFSAAYNVSSYGSGSTDNSLLIPYKIYGIK